MTLIALGTGVLFGLGLGLGGMTQPAKVQAFLDFFGDWDPSLMFVMGGAVTVYTLFFRLVRPRLSAPLFAPRFQLPTRRDLDARLVIGAALFGVGWGLGGVCPGPAITSVAAGGLGVFVFIAAMLIGLWIAPSPRRP